MRLRLAGGGRGVWSVVPPPPIRVQACDSLPPPQTAWSIPPVLRIWVLSLKVVVVPPLVTWIAGMYPVGLHVIGVSDVSKLSPPVPLRIRICPGARLTFLGQMS